MSATWRRLRTEDGSPTLVHPVHGEACHGREGAWLQARQRYAAGCGLPARARAGDRVRLLDVGTGVGWNLAAALHAVASGGARLEAHTFELDRAPLEASRDLAHSPGLEPEAARSLRAVGAALAIALDAPGRPVPLVRGGVERGTVVLHLGDARDTLPQLAAEPVFDAVFLDPFSPAVAPELWAEPFVAQLARRLAPGGLLATYSAATRVRVALARAGLGVARGPEVGRKREGTLAGPDLVAPAADADLVRRIARHLGVNPSPGLPPGPPAA